MQSDPRAVFNRNCSAGLLLLNGGLLYAVGRSGYLARYFHPDTLEIFAFLVPILLFTGLLAGVAWSLPTRLSWPFSVLLGLGLLLCVGGLWLAWYATHFLRGKW